MTISILILFFPLLAGVLIRVFGKHMSSYVAKVGVIATASSFFLSVWALLHVSTEGPIHLMLWPLSPENSSILKVGMLIDRLTAVMMVLITSVSAVIHVYSIRYLEGDSGYARFFALLSFMTFVILSLVSSPNLFMLFVFWQLLSWALYLILAFNFPNRPACQNAFKTFFVHRVGDASFLCGIFLAYKYFGTLEFTELFKAAKEQPQLISLFSGMFDINAVTAITFLIFVGAMAKSSQFPLHVWLPDTMDSPTPVSALMHAGIVNAGGFLLNRLAPFYALSPNTLHFVFVVGFLTVLLGASMMLAQNDIKKTLGFSTMGQMGYMIMECGLGAFALAIFHLIAHGLFKASLFLGAGQGIHASREEPKFPNSSGHEPQKSSNSLTFVTGLILTLIIPLIILMVAHGMLDIPLQEDSHGTVILLFFAWVTASQVMFSLYRLHAVASWKVAGAMIVSLFLIGFVYLWAAEVFTHFLYPEPGVSDGFFVAAALNPRVFDMLILLSTVLILISWISAYTQAKGENILITHWVNSFRKRLYILLINRFYVDIIYLRWSNNLLRLAQKVAHRF